MNIKKYWMTLAIALVGVCTISCGGDDEDEGGTRDNPVTMADPEGTIVVNLANDKKVYLRYFNYIYMNSANNLVTNVTEIVSVGNVKGLSSITRIPETGWSNTTAAIPGYGYVLRNRYWEDNQTKYRYARIYAVDYMTSTSGGIMGITIKYQENWEPDAK